MNKTAIILTVYNEEKTIEQFLDSVISQTVLPDEVVIVDGGSTDNTIEKIKTYIKDVGKIAFKIYIKRGNRSVGRNEAIKKSSSEHILITDAGCLLHKKWVEMMKSAFQKTNADVVAGYYSGKAKSLFQKALLPYVFVMPDKVDKKNFLPATRSMGIKKQVWKEMKGFDIRYSHNEDYVFAHSLVKSKKKIVFEKRAIVYWMPRNDIKSSANMFYRFALGDMESGIIRPKVILIFVRYLLFIYLAFYAKVSSSLFYFSFCVILFVSYLLYIYWKNRKYVSIRKSLLILPLIQITSDFSVMLGSVVGLCKRYYYGLKNFSLKNNAWLLLIVFFYLLATVPFIAWGVPNPSHPFFYQMDEWHTLQSVRHFFSEGTVNVPGAAYGMAFFFFLSGLFLVPFYAFHLIDPFQIVSSVGSLEMQEKLSVVLRLSTILYGCMSIVLFRQIVRNIHKKDNWWLVMLFVLTPIWITLSVLFKYDIAVVFWILLSIYFSLSLISNPSRATFFYLTAISSLTLSIKVSAVPVIPILAFSYFLFIPKALRSIKDILVSIAIFCFVLLVFGMPDISSHFQDYYNLIHLNTVDGPRAMENYLLSGSQWGYLLKYEYPSIFGVGFYIIFLISLFYLILKVVSNIRNYSNIKVEVYLLMSFIFYMISLIPLGLGAGTNRALVLLPFMCLIMLVTFSKYTKSKLIKTFLILLMVSQLFQLGGWVSTRFKPDPRAVSSIWIKSNLKQGSEIGIENIPIYQMLPDIIVKDFYSESISKYYRLHVIDSKSKKFPKYIIISGGDSINLYLKNSDKQRILNRLKKENYQLIKSFTPNFTYFDLVAKRREFVIANLIPMPTAIEVYQKANFSQQ